MGGASGMIEVFEVVQSALINVKVVTKKKINYFSGPMQTCRVNTYLQIVALTYIILLVLNMGTNFFYF
jgi:hypothetical protein